MLYVSMVEQLSSGDRFGRLFAEMLPGFREVGLSASSWAVFSGDRPVEWDQQPIIISWGTDEQSQDVEAFFSQGQRRYGIPMVTKALRSLRLAALPSPGVLGFCDLQFNTHLADNIKSCSGGHSFDREHDFDNCTICGHRLR
jgi:hypothetical protein